VKQLIKHFFLGLCALTLVSPLQINAREQDQNPNHIMIRPLPQGEIDPANQKEMLESLQKKYKLDFSGFWECNSPECVLTRIPGFVSVRRILEHRVVSILTNVWKQQDTLSLVSFAGGGLYQDLMILHTLFTEAKQKKINLKKKTLNFYLIEPTCNQTWQKGLLEKLCTLIQSQCSEKSFCSTCSLSAQEFIETNKDLKPNFIYGIDIGGKDKETEGLELIFFWLCAHYKDTPNILIAPDTIDEKEPQFKNSITIIKINKNKEDPSPFYQNLTCADAQKKQIDFLQKTADEFESYVTNILSTGTISEDDAWELYNTNDAQRILSELIPKLFPIVTVEDTQANSLLQTLVSLKNDTSNLYTKTKSVITALANQIKKEKFNIKEFLQPFKEAALKDGIETIKKTFEGIDQNWSITKAGLFAHAAFAEDLVTQTISLINQAKFTDFVIALGKIV